MIDPCEGVECQEHAVCEVLEDSTTTCSCKTCDKGDFDSLNLVIIIIDDLFINMKQVLVLHNGFFCLIGKYNSTNLTSS